MKPLLLSFLAGLVAALGFEPVGVWPLTLLGLMGLLWLVRDAGGMRGALARGWWFGVGNFVLGLNWIATAFTYQSEMPAWLGWIAVVLLSLYLAIYPAMAAGLAWRWGVDENRSPAKAGVQPSEDSGPRPSPGHVRFILIFAAAWIVTEWLRATMFTGFAWNPLGVALLPTFFSYLSQWVGTYGLSGIAVLLAGAFLLPLVAERERRAAAVLILVLFGASGLSWLLRGEPQPGARTAIVIVQPNIGQQDKWREGFRDLNFERLRRLSQGLGQGPTLLLWPEAAVTEPLQDGRAADPSRLIEAEMVRRRTASVLGPDDLMLTGGITVRSVDGETAAAATNSVFAIAGRNRILARYDKAHLVPYGEYLPARPILSAIGLSRLAPGDIDFDPGPGPQTIALPLIGKAGFQLCYEMIFSGQVVEKGNRPDFLFNPSNDAWFGAWGPPQHLAQAQLRALEEGLPVLRSTPTGISAVIDAEGRLLHSLPWRTAGVIRSTLPLPKPPTPFARGGNLLPLLLALLLAGLALAPWRKARPVAVPGEAR